MKTLARVLPGVLGGLFLVIGLLFMLNAGAESVLDRLELIPSGIGGLAAIRSFIGGTFVGMAMLLISGAIKSHAKPMLIVGLFLTTAVIGRIFGLMLDGANASLIGAVVIEVVFIAIIGFSYVTLRKFEMETA